ncbi:PucR family transcriptional regulator ligand-binding domain-containing protein [Streptomyces sp. NPDC002952]|uniref:PucR family transcriptional regulator ligand-binding domain-containing protein n=1 Tax=Streptomyces sp. NPDC002952 TaxID=3364673 RepID=UPI00368B1121
MEGTSTVPDPAVPPVPPTPPVPLGALLARDDLGLRRIAGPADPDTVIHWAHTSEMADPYPYLLGGELLLTAGVHIPEAAGSGTYFDDYVSRIVAAGGAALGFGLAPVHDTVPRALVAACDAYGLPLLEVPPQTTFSGVARAVWQLMAQARLAELRRVTEAQQSLAAAAARPDPVPAVLRRLARHTDGWAALYGPEGRELATAGRVPRTPAPDTASRSAPRTATPEAADRAPGTQAPAAGATDPGARPAGPAQDATASGPRPAETAQSTAPPRPRPAGSGQSATAPEARPAGSAQGAATSGPRPAGATQDATAPGPRPAGSVPGAADAEGWVVGALRELAGVVRPRGRAGGAVPPGPSSATDTVGGVHLAAYALGAGQGFVLGVAGARRAPGDHTIASVAAVLLSLLTGEHQSGTGAARSAALVRLLLGATPGEVAPLLGAERLLVVHARPAGDAPAPDAVAASALGAALGSTLVDVGDDVVRVLVPAGREPAPQPGWTCGVSAPAAPDGWAAADTQAARALARARATRAALVRHGERPALADLVPASDAEAHARALLAPVAGQPALTETLRTWLSLHGSWDRTAVALSVHRNTVRQRITRCAALLAADLDDPDVRMELWFALREG